MRQAAFKATYSDWKLVKTRGVIQVVFEVPLADSDMAYDVLGGMPDASKEHWFGIAAIQSAETTRRREVVRSDAKHSNTGTMATSIEVRPDQDHPPPDRAKRDWRDLQPQQQAGIRCEEPSFEAFLKEERADDWHEAQEAAECVRLICGVSSRSELGNNQKARTIWHQLDEQYQAWKALEHA